MKIIKEIEENELPEKSKRLAILENLREKGYLSYGAIIPEKEMKLLMDISELEDKDEYTFAQLQLRGIIQNEGYFCTSRGRCGDIYILTAKEMPNHNEQKNKSAYHALQTRQRALHMINPTDLDADEKKKLEFEILRNGAIEIQMHENLKKRCRF